ncbi:MAG: O-antigen ligase family protein [Saonia sp.]
MSEIKVYLNRVGFLIIALLIFFLVDPYQKNFLAGYLLTALIYIKKDFFVRSLDFDFVILFLFSVVYALFSILDPDIFTQTVIFYGVFPPVFYLLGKYLMSKTDKVQHIFMIMLTVGFLYSISALFSVFLNLKGGGFAQFDRSIPMFWDGSKPIKATLMAAYFTFNMCIPALLLVRFPKFNLPFKIVISFIFALSLLCVFRLGSRTQLAIFLITTAATLIFIIPRQSLNQNVRLFIALIIAVCVIYLYVPFDLNSEYMSTLGRRLQNSDNTGSAGGRTELWARSLENMLKKPLGWERSEFGYSHNLWLDVARIHGVIPFFILLIFSIRSIINVRRAIVITKDSMSVKAMFFSFTLAANLMFFVEPVTEGLFSFFLVYSFFQGATKNYILFYNRNHHINTTV